MRRTAGNEDNVQNKGRTLGTYGVDKPLFGFFFGVPDTVVLLFRPHRQLFLDLTGRDTNQRRVLNRH